MTAKSQIIIIGGPTAVGKSALAVGLAKKFGGEVVGADSMQIYRRLNIGTGKITEAEADGVPHHMIDIVNPNERYSVGQYLIDASKEIDDVLSKNKLPIVVGGTALYLNALINGMNFSDADRSDDVRKKWIDIASQNGKQYVYDYLRQIDPESAAKISVNDVKRVIRAIEIYEVTGSPKSKSATTAECRYDYKLYIMTRERAELYGAIEARVDKMFDMGLEEEVRELMPYRECQSMQAIGYKQLCDYFDGNYASLDAVREEIKKLSRNYAKRQLTFFRGMNADKIFVDYSDAQKAIEKYISNFIK